MKYAILRAPHPNARYDAELDKLTLCEIDAILERSGLSQAAAPGALGGLGLYFFEGDAVPEALYRLSSLMGVFAVEGETLRGALSSLGLSETVRGEALSVEAWIALANACARK